VSPPPRRRARRAQGAPDATPRYAFVLEGPCEVNALPALLEGHPVEVIKRVHVGGQPAASPLETFVTKKLLPKLQQVMIAVRDVPVGVVFDRENRVETADEVARETLRLISPHVPQHRRVFVAVADQKFENWLIADPDGVVGHALILRDFKSKVGTDADSKDAIGILKWAMRNGDYDKTKHAPSLAKLVRVGDGVVQGRSASLRAFLAELR